MCCTTMKARCNVTITMASACSGGGVLLEMTSTTGRRVGRLLTLVGLWLAPLPAVAADPTSPRSGFYVGGHVGFMFGNATATLADPIGIQSAGGSTGYGT